jgi:nicotinate-nucleotide adenylyltransferase
VRLALFGGTFDPIHNAHLAIAHAAVRQLTLDLVRFIPAGKPPHKSGAHAGYEDRVRMAELACATEPAFEVSRLEAGDRHSYSIVTIERVLAEEPRPDPLFFLIGADAFAEINTWKRWRDVIAAVEFIVVSRPHHGYEIPAGARVHLLEGLELAVSSTAIREALARGCRNVPAPRPVLEYIAERGLYRS